MSGLACHAGPVWGSVGNKITIKGHPDYARPVLDGRDATSGTPRSDGIVYSRTICPWTDSTMDYIEVNGTACGVTVTGHRISIFDSIIHNSAGGQGHNCAGIRTDPGAPSHSNLIVRGTEVYDIFVERSGRGLVRAEPAITVYRMKDGIFENNYFHDNAGGIEFKNQVTGSIIKGNVFKDLLAWGILQQCSSDQYKWDAGNNDIFENVFYRAGNGAGDKSIVALHHSGVSDGCEGHPYRDMRVFNNVIYEGNNSGIRLFIDFSYVNDPPVFEDFRVLNNIVVNISAVSGDGKNLNNLDYMDAQYLPGFISDHNILYDDFEDIVVTYVSGGYTLYNLAQWQTASLALFPDGQDRNSIQEDPQFVSTDFFSPDFLKPGPGSPAIDRGVVIDPGVGPGYYHCPQADDDLTSPMDPSADCKHYWGKPDIGAFEFNPN